MFTGAPGFPSGLGPSGRRPHGMHIASLACLVLNPGPMFIQFHTDHNISATDTVTAALSESISHVLNRFSHQISSVQVHLADENAKKGGEKDKRCVLEARLDGMEPIAVTGRADTVEQALKSALDKLKVSLDTRRDKLKSY